jgi:23S rRNA (uracil1939-C5)-methyltransferase
MKIDKILSPLRVEKLVFSGKWLARAEDGRAVMIGGGVIPGQLVSVRVLKSRKGHLEGQLLDILEHSPLEGELPAHYQVYWGCKWLPIKYEEQLRIKSEQVSECFAGLRAQGLLSGTTEHPIIASPETYGYRNKLEFSYGKYISAKEGIEDHFRFGFHKQAEFDRIIDCTYCVLASERVNEIFVAVDALSRASGFPTYDPKRNEGVLRHLVIRESKHTGECILVMSTNTASPDFDRARFDAFAAGVGAIPGVSSLVLLHNTGRADIVTGEVELLKGSGTITERLLGVDFEIRPKSFFQTNTVGAEVLYGAVRDLLKGSREKRASENGSREGGVLLDLYAGTGTIGILLSGGFDRVYSVEIVADASADAARNARAAGLAVAQYESGTVWSKGSVTEFIPVNLPAERFLADYITRGERAETLVIDPPRDGMHPSTLPSLLAFGAREIIYVSCNPSTLVRDLGVLLGAKVHEPSGGDEEKNEEISLAPLQTGARYRLTDIIPVDMFPHTHHIETVVRLELIPGVE